MCGGDLFTLFCLMIPTGVNKLDKLIIKTSLIRNSTEGDRFSNRRVLKGKKDFCDSEVRGGGV